MCVNKNTNCILVTHTHTHTQSWYGDQYASCLFPTWGCRVQQGGYGATTYQVQGHESKLKTDCWKFIFTWTDKHGARCTVRTLLLAPSSAWTLARAFKRPRSRASAHHARCAHQIPYNIAFKFKLSCSTSSFRRLESCAVHIAHFNKIFNTQPNHLSVEKFLL